MRALVAIGHSPARLAQELGVPARTVRNIVCGGATSISQGTYERAAELYDRLWDQPPVECTRAQRREAEKARAQAASHNWPPPMGLDDDRIDEPGYRPRARWRPVAGMSAATPGDQGKTDAGLHH